MSKFAPPKMSDPAPPPPPPPDPPVKPTKIKEASRTVEKAKRKRGQEATNVTGGMLTADATATTKKTLLGG